MMSLTTGMSSINVPIPSAVAVSEVVIPHTNKWVQIGLILGICPTDIERIRIDCQDEESRFQEVLTKWQRLGQPPFTWNTLVQVLKSPTVQEFTLATVIEEQFLV